MKIFIHQHKLVAYYNSQICDENYNWLDDNLVSFGVISLNLR